MKKKTVIALIVAAALVITGIGFLAVGLSSSGDWTAATTPVEKTYVVTEDFSGIRVETTVCDVTLVKTDGDFRAVCPDAEKFSYTVTVEENTLCVRQVDLRKWYDFVGLDLGSPGITLYLPGDLFDTLYMETSTGDIQVPADFSFETAEIATSTGDVRFSAAVADRLTARSSTGDLTFRGGAPTQMQISATTGDVTLQALSCQDCSVSTTTGRIVLEDLACGSLRSQSSTGDQQLRAVITEDSLWITATTGKVTLQNCDAAEAQIETDTGDVSGNFLTEKWFQATSSTGHISVPMTRGGGICRVTTGTGDITFTWE